jgi:AraC family transcriptional regulator, activator of mtrCDE
VLLERLFENLDLTVEPFASCEVSDGWRLRLEALDRVTLHFVLRGEGTLRVGAARYPLDAHTLAVVPPGRGHAFERGTRPEHETTGTMDAAGEPPRLLAGPGGGSELVVLCGRVQVTYGQGLGLFDQLQEPIVMDFSTSQEMQALFAKLTEEQADRAPGSAVMTTALMYECLVLVFRRLCGEPDCPLPWLRVLEDPRMSRVLEVILAHPEHSHSLESLAEAARMSRSAFAEEFAASFDRTPMAYLRDVRLRKAAALLRGSTLTVDAVAKRIGFASRSHFSRAFQERFGEPPASFRRVE